MSGWTRHEGRAVALLLESIDTDQLIPARFMSAPRAAGYGGFLLHDLRHDADGQPLPAFPLNAAPGASILLAGRNFGAGSSREAAVYALCDYGIRCVIAPSFGDIFSGNAAQNGLLTAIVSDGDAAAMTAELEASPERPLTVDLEAQTIRCGERTYSFAVDPVRRSRLLNGWDDVALTESFRDRIAAFRATDRRRRPWAAPAC